MKSESQRKDFRRLKLIRWVLPLCFLNAIAVPLIYSNAVTIFPKLLCSDSCEHTEQNGSTKLAFETSNDVQSENSTTRGDREEDLSAMKCSFMPWYKSTAKPMWIPGYPGSGSEMLRVLVKAITGLGGDEIYTGSRCFNSTATCKTHYPKVPVPRLPHKSTHLFINRTVILIRNPKAALASYFNYLWERKNLKVSHLVQAPEEAWNEWRDKESTWEGFSDYWAGLIQSWKKQTDYEIAFYLPYERLTNNETGPRLLSRLGAELRRNGVRVAPEEDIPCLWNKALNGRKASKGTKRAAHKYIPSYTTQQQAFMLRALDNLRQKFRDDSELVEILSMYYEDIRTNLRIYQLATDASDTQAQ